MSLQPLFVILAGTMLGARAGAGATKILGAAVLARSVKPSSLGQ